MADFNECDHEALKIEHNETRAGQVELWVACHDCEGYWDVAADLKMEEANVSRERP
jgi:hypothetical protein